ncbi:MAG: hypothetical protein K8R69_03000 [Deltaproteobacteria bacterium]|nr:hypothetical protein [Deltaproteobacteria bacterium]
MKETLGLHLVQFSTKAGGPAATLDGLQSLLKSLRPNPGDWLVFPEMWPSGFSVDHRAALARGNAECLAWLQNYARTRQCYLVGSMLELAKKRAYNSAYVITPSGKRLASYRKIHLFAYGGETRRFQAGKRVVAFSSPWGKIGLAVCFDLRFPELFRRLSKLGTRLIFLPSAWPKERLDHFTACSRHGPSKISAMSSVSTRSAQVTMKNR